MSISSWRLLPDTCQPAALHPLVVLSQGCASPAVLQELGSWLQLSPGEGTGWALPGLGGENTCPMQLGSDRLARGAFRLHIPFNVWLRVINAPSQNRTSHTCRPELPPGWRAGP